MFDKTLAHGLLAVALVATMAIASALTTAATYGQVTAHEAGSVGAAQALQNHQQRAADWRAEVANSNAVYKKAIETGRDLFGVDDCWAGEELAGTLKNKTAKEVINANLVAVTKEYKVGDWGCTTVVFQVINKVSKTECLVQEVYRTIRGPSDPPVLLIRGFDMSKVTDDAKLVLQHPIVIRTTYDYTTVAGGRKTVLVLERDDAKMKGIAEAARAEKDRKAAEKRKAADERARLVKKYNDAIEAAKWRTWTDSSGTKTYARFAGMTLKRVKIIKKDGSTVYIPVEDLSEEERDWIKNRGKTTVPTESNEATTKPGPQTAPAETVEDKATVVKSDDGEAKAVDVQKSPVQVAAYRTWTDSSGTHKIEGKFGGVDGGKVKLIKRDGTTIQLPLEKLSDEDKEWIENRSKRPRKNNLNKFYFCGNSV